MAAIFLSYRQSDSPEAVASLQDRLAQRLFGARIFRDADDLPLGVSVPTHLRQEIGDADVVLVAIGPNWTTARDEQGRRQLEDPNDVVRIAVETALRSDVPVVPVLVAGASMPAAGDLPASMRPLTTRRGMALRPGVDFRSDVDLLVTGIEKLGTPRRERDRAGSPPDAITSMPVDPRPVRETPGRSRAAQTLDWDRDDEPYPSIRNDDPDAEKNAPQTGALGIASFVIALVAGVSMMAMFLTAGLMVHRAGGKLGRQPSMVIGFVFLGLIAFAGLGAVLGFIGILGRFRAKTLAGVGFGLNGLMFVGSIALIVVSLYLRR
jgi:TIR domain